MLFLNDVPTDHLRSSLPNYEALANNGLYMLGVNLKPFRVFLFFIVFLKVRSLSFLFSYPLSSPRSCLCLMPISRDMHKQNLHYKERVSRVTARKVCRAGGGYNDCGKVG